eukprot:1160150-Pelagomonas_calceolata.AAC.4
MQAVREVVTFNIVRGSSGLLLTAPTPCLQVAQAWLANGMCLAVCASAHAFTYASVQRQPQEDLVPLVYAHPYIKEGLKR